MREIDGSCLSWMVRIVLGLDIVRWAHVSWERFRKAEALSFWPKNRIQSQDGVIKGQVGECAGSRMTESAETIIDTEPRIPDAHVSWERPRTKGSCRQRPLNAQNPSAPVSWCQVLKIDHRWCGPKMLENAIEHEGVGGLRCTNTRWNQWVEGFRAIKPPRRCAVGIVCDQPISAPLNILGIYCAGCPMTMGSMI